MVIVGWYGSLSNRLVDPAFFLAEKSGACIFVAVLSGCFAGEHRRLFLCQKKSVDQLHIPPADDEYCTFGKGFHTSRILVLVIYAWFTVHYDCIAIPFYSSNGLARGSVLRDHITPCSILSKPRFTHHSG